MKYKDGNATEIAQGLFFTYDFDDSAFDDVPGIDYIEQFNNISPFLNGIKKRLTELGHADITDDPQMMRSALMQYCREADVTISRQTLGNWITKAAPNGSYPSRENVYKLCFALKMNANQTGEFFLKAYLERPFNYKDIHEVVYFFCLQTGRSYTTACTLIDKIEKEPFIENPEAATITEQIGSTIQTIENEDDFVKYIVDNRAGFSIQNKTATETIKKLIETCIPLAYKEHILTTEQLEELDAFAKLEKLQELEETEETEESEESEETEKTKKLRNNKRLIVKSIDSLLAVIYGYSARERMGDELVHQASIKKSSFPILIKQNFPGRQELQRILDHKASFDVIRKSLIMLKFYEFFVTAKLDNVEDDVLFDDFVLEMDTTLEDCGYVQLYWRNPFDWMIGYCAVSNNPLTTLRNLILEFYLSEEE